MGLMGSMAALAHMPAQDEILKNAFANSAVEAYEIAAYTSLLTIAEAAGDHASIPAFRQSLAEEEAMAARIRSMADAITTVSEKIIWLLLAPKAIMRLPIR